MNLQHQTGLPGVASAPRVYHQFDCGHLEEYWIHLYAPFPDTLWPCVDVLQTIFWFQRSVVLPTMTICCHQGYKPQVGLEHPKKVQDRTAVANLDPYPTSYKSLFLLVGHVSWLNQQFSWYNHQSLVKTHLRLHWSCPARLMACNYSWPQNSMGHKTTTGPV